jgi:ribonuclease HII
MYNMVMVAIDLIKGERIQDMVLIGVDEAGRGSLAGPLVVGAVIIKEGIVEGVADSKLLAPKKREELAPKIMELADGYGLGWVWPNEIDELGLTKATQKGIERAVSQIPIDYDQLITDGNTNYWPENPRVTTIVDADNIIYEVSAASILAKVARDEYMQRLGERYPNYKFEDHVGYSTLEHRQALEESGTISGIHRIKNIPKLGLLYRMSPVSHTPVGIEAEAA